VESLRRRAHLGRCATSKSRSGPPANSAPEDFFKRVSSTARFTLGDGFGQAYVVKRRETVVRGIEHKSVQLAAANADIAAGEKRQQHSVLKQTGERQFVAITVDAYNLHEIGNDPHRRFRSEHLGVDGELECTWRSRIERAACMPAQHPRSLNRRLRIGQRVADCLMFDDLLDASTLLALGEGKSKLKSSAHQRYTEDTDESDATRKALRSQLESAPLLSQQISGRNLNSGRPFTASVASRPGIGRTPPRWRPLPEGFLAIEKESYDRSCYSLVMGPLAA
jgi:hypothetical protein